ncbi:ABC transporter substrate-binding protein [Nonomuraea cavernae]|uniref:Amino acid-binding protein n=1 Tax=Nonomuraea cavernae TaxID=2045107 RepID=A0A918DRY7_9ACTN|nr:ABC transporter substrate-binding protein [Nonomuraea cavernae]MCA2190416.1 ABC transporter substrate-binding protein [Nonomuraea cavernae]GGO79705.1 amino acid-binding protein [Nonomuraea cavernae]
MPRRDRRLTGFTVTAASLMLLATGCGVQRDEAGGTAASAAPSTCDTKEESPGVTESEIKLGVTSGLSGPSASAAKPALDGQQWYFDKINAAGGIQGRKIKLTVLDDQYQPNVALQNVRRLVDQENVFAITGGVGTQNFVGGLPYINQAKIPAVAPYAPSNQIGTMQNPYVYMLWTNFSDEFEALTRFLIEKRNVKSFSILAMNGDVGDDALAGAKKVLDAAGMEFKTVVRSEPNTTDYRPIAEQLKQAGADYVLFLATPPDVGNAITAMQKIGYKPGIGAQSDMLDSGWIEAFGSVAQGLVAPSKLANLEKSDDPKVKQFVADWTSAHSGKAPTSWNTVGYVQALVTAEALKQAEALTRSCFEASLQKMTDFETGVIPPITFGPQERQGVRAAGIEGIKDTGTVTEQPFTAIGN